MSRGRIRCATSGSWRNVSRSASSARISQRASPKGVSSNETPSNPANSAQLAVSSPQHSHNTHKIDRSDCMRGRLSRGDRECWVSCGTRERNSDSKVVRPSFSRKSETAPRLFWKMLPSKAVVANSSSVDSPRNWLSAESANWRQRTRVCITAGVRESAMKPSRVRRRMAQTRKDARG